MPHPQRSGVKKTLRFKNDAERRRLPEWEFNRRLRPIARTSRSAIVAVACERKSCFGARRSYLAFWRFNRLNGLHKSHPC